MKEHPREQFIKEHPDLGGKFEIYSYVNWLEEKLLSHQSAPKEDGKVLLPRNLTAENGAKELLIGEFSEYIESEDPEDSYSVPVKWTTIKDIYARIVESFSPPKEECMRLNYPHNNRCVNCGVKAGQPCAINPTKP